MNTTKFSILLQEPNAITKEQTIAIEDVLDNYPYFQAAKMLHLKGLKKQSSYKYNDALKVTAAHTTNRTILFDYITADVLDVSTNHLEEEKLIANSEIIDLEVIDKANEYGSSTTKTETIQIIEEKLDIGKPLTFDLSEMHSFHQWLQVTSSKPIERHETKPAIKQNEKDTRFDIIEEFIKNKPKIKPASTSETSDIGIESATENKSIMTETLARVYLEQKKYDKAMQAFKILSLKYPEKSSFFADRIKAIKFLQKNNS